ncbi:MAG TPA: hypothetical protein VGJ19_23770 [Streptosporangiaceae bacterium]
MTRRSRTIGDAASSASVTISVRYRGTKNATSCAADACLILVMTMKSNGNSKTIGAARAPMAAPVSRTGQPYERPSRTMTTKVTPTAVKVTGAIGPISRTWCGCCWRVC